MIFTDFVLLVLKMIDSHCHVWSQECNRCQPWAHVGQEVQGNNDWTSEMKLYTVECSKFEKGHPFFLRWFHRHTLFFMLFFLRSFRCTVGFSRCDWFGVCCQLGMEPWNETTTCLAHLVLVISWLRTHDGEHQELIGAKGHTCSLQQPATAASETFRLLNPGHEVCWVIVTTQHRLMGPLLGCGGLPFFALQAAGHSARNV